MILSSRVLISDILYLLWFKNDNDTSDSLKIYGGNLADAISNASSIGIGFWGFSDGSPYWTLSNPTLVKYILSILPT